MIINIAGTNGSGKSTVVRNLIADLDDPPEPERQPERQSPIGYEASAAGHPLYIIGAYEFGTGGADTIKRFGVGPIFELIERKARAGANVIYEGAFVMNHTRGPELVQRLGLDFNLLLLTTPLETCFRSIQERRDQTEFASPAAQRKNIEGNHVRAQNYATKMRLAGARVHRVSREQALGKVWELLRG